MSEAVEFEIGPIRPPSEAGSYLLRLTRNCPWNRCRFCRTYKRHRFSLRPVEEIEAQIDEMARIRDRLRAEGGSDGPRALVARGLVTTEAEWMVANALANGGRTAFLQDADSLVMKPENLKRVLVRFRERFPEVERITTYARSRTVARLPVEVLRTYGELGLTRIHIGMETGHDPLLELIKKGATAEIHIKAGRKVKEAGLELSEYIIPGLGGREMSEGHALDSARVLNAIDPDFIRLRTLTLGPKVDLWSEFHGPEARLTRQTDAEIVAEIRRFIEALDGIHSRLVSDHIMNLLGDLEGRLPDEKQALLDRCDAFLSLDAGEQRLYQVARRAGLVNGLSDLEIPEVRARAESLLAEVARSYGPDRIEEACRDMMLRFV
ncbi:radical SAM protein [Deferrisoma camini]|uniref:radical SAM protein n=1 Tax=Deferrisoma camini TaxID=1035120 RepID=UPI00046C9C62|nr:radical SAM protein [Deferrisoma camini]